MRTRNERLMEELADHLGAGPLPTAVLDKVTKWLAERNLALTGDGLKRIKGGKGNV